MPLQDYQLRLCREVLEELQGRLDYLHTRVEKVRGSAEFIREILDVHMEPPPAPELPDSTAPEGGHR